MSTPVHARSAGEGVVVAVPVVTGRRLVALHLSLIALLAAISFYPGLYSDFVFDDLPNIVINPAVHPDTLGEVAAAFGSTVSPTRPLANLSFALNHWLGGFDTFGYHLVNLVLHVGVAWLLYALCFRLAQALPAAAGATGDGEDGARWRAGQIAFWSAALWALNPVQVQAVTYVVQRMTVLAALCYIGALLLYVLYRQRRLAGAAAGAGIGVLFAAGMASKEIVVTLPLALLLVEVLFFTKRFGRREARFALAAAGVVAAFGMAYLRGHMPDWSAAYPGRDFGPLERVLTQGRVLWHYLSLYALPLPDRLHLDYHVTVSTSPWSPWTTVPAWAGIAGVLVAAWRFRARFPLAALAAGFFFLASALEASFVNLELAFVHRLYLPSAFLAAGALSLLPARVFRRAGPALMLAVALLAAGTVQRNVEWGNRASVWALDMERGASPVRGVVNLAVALTDAGRAGEALPLLEEIRDAATGMDVMIVLHALGVAYFFEGEYDRSLAVFGELGRRFGEFHSALYYTGLGHLRMGNMEAARRAAARLDAVAGGAWMARVLDAEILRAEGAPRRAIALLETAYRDVPKELVDPVRLVSMHLADLYLEAGEHDAAYAIYRDAVARSPDDYFAWRQLYRMQMAAGDQANAAKIRRLLEAKHVAVPAE